MNKKEVINEDYYDNTTKKANDFFVGFFGTLLGAGAVWYLYGMFFLMVDKFLTDSIYSDFSNNFYTGFNYFIIIILLILFGFLIKYFFKNKRHFIVFGMITAVTIPLLAFGACFTIIGVL